MGMGIGISPLGMSMGMMSPGAEMSLHGLGQSLYGLTEQAEGKMDNRSAYVETVEDVGSLFLRATRWRGEIAPRRPSIASFVGRETEQSLAHRSRHLLCAPCPSCHFDRGRYISGRT
jgi:hypothetical protein